MKTIITSCIVASALALSGCETTGVSTLDSSSSGSGDYAWIAADSDVRRHIFVESANQAKLDGGITKVQVVLKNSSQKEKSFNYLFEWKDSQGFSVRNPNSSWKTVRLKPKETISLTAISPNPSGEDFTLKLERND